MGWGEPTVTCMRCKRVRRCEPHRRANEPAKAARTWMQRRCPKKTENCDIRYTAGIILGTAPRGMSAELRKLIYG